MFVPTANAIAKRPEGGGDAERNHSSEMQEAVKKQMED